TGITNEQHVLVGDGTVDIKDVPDNMLVYGNPMKITKKKKMNKNNNVISLDQNGENYYRQGIKKRQQNNKKEAMQLLKKAYDKNPSNPDYLSEYVYVMTENGLGNEAEHMIINEYVKDDYDVSYF